MKLFGTVRRRRTTSNIRWTPIIWTMKGPK
jgi:hypothetical protein